MFIGTILLTYLIPVQINLINPSRLSVEYCWTISSVIDVARLIGLPAYKKRGAIQVNNNELIAQIDAKDVRQSTKRRLFIKNFIDKSVVMSAR